MAAQNPPGHPGFMTLSLSACQLANLSSALDAGHALYSLIAGSNVGKHTMQQGMAEGWGKHLVVRLSIGDTGLRIPPVGQGVGDVAHLPGLIRGLEDLDPLVCDGHLQAVIEAHTTLRYRPAHKRHGPRIQRLLLHCHNVVFADEQKRHLLGWNLSGMDRHCHEL